MRTGVFEQTAAIATGEGETGLQRLVERVLEHVATEDLTEREPRDLVGAVASLRDLAATRAADRTLVRVFSPTLRENGWTTRRTVVQVCTDDSPFLVDSVTAAVAREDLTVHLLVHPLLVVRRDPDGRLEQVRDERPPTAAGAVESWMHLEVDRLPGPDAEAALAAALGAVLDDVRAAVEDWLPMRHACEAIAHELGRGVPATVDVAEVAPAREFLRWLADDHFTFVGYREYDLTEAEVPGGGRELVLAPRPGSGLGVLREPTEPYSRLRPEAQAGAREPRLLTVTKANSRSTVHRPVYLDYVGIRTFDADGAVTGEKRFLGLFTSTAYAESVLRLPIAAEKARAVLERSGYAADSHSGKDLLQILEAYPRDELFAIDVARLTATVQEVQHLQGRRRARVFIRKDEFGRYASVLAYVPRDRYTTSVRLRLEALLREAFDAEHVDFTTRLTDSPLVQLHFVVRSGAGRSVPDIAEDLLQERMLEAIRTWDERLADAVHATTRAGGEEEDEEASLALLSGFRFSEAYKEDVDAADAPADLRRLASLAETGTGSVHLTPLGDDPRARRFRLYADEQLSLTRVLPVLTDLGVEVVDERPYSVEGPSGPLHVYDFGLRLPEGQRWDADGSAFETAFTAVWSGVAESDALNGLVLRAGIDWRRIVALRAVGRYLRQIGSTFSMEYIESALVANPGLAARVVRLFETRFDPDRPGSQDDRAQDAAAQVQDILHALDDVASLDADRILRAFVGVVRATLRTSFYQAGEDGVPGSHKPYVSLKIDCRKVPDLPLPHPMVEIWVYAPQVEGIHLRFGRIARGGLRWSDRREDFRTEVLGLVKAQMVKNAVIIPTGSKGGFVGKQLPDPAADRGAWVEAGKAAYRTFVRGLLDLTDNRVDGEIVGPDRVIRHDGDDPYLVVAADKGTATFSDVANAISREHGFWLDDAFASGGSAGYDHKAMGITARGAWESVKRHFRELGLDTQAEDFTVIGIGDMSGDVFGNGMLLSEHIRLVAAFDHRHVFLDPNPDPALSFAERRRLFALPTSSWADYDAALLSEGGGVHARTAKSVPITPQVRAALGIAEPVEAMTPADLIRRILMAPVDLFWNGGIGTYVKAGEETDADAGDRANDAIRVDGAQLRCRVVGEGGNLGATQLGRIEAAQAGVQINTDAIDNSAGVGTSDKEVNLKIALTDLVRSGALTLDERNDLLASMTDEVATQVLRDNYEQNVLLGNSRANSAVMLPVHVRLIEWLEERGELRRELEHLPGHEEIDRRLQAGLGLTRPEFAVLVAYAKLALKADLATTGLADEPWFARTLAEYFPAPVRERFGDALAAHPLRREIIVNAVVNSMVNRGGITFAYRAADETGASSEQIARAFVTCREIYGLRSFVQAVEATDNQVPTLVQTGLYLAFRRLLDRSARWLVLHRPDLVDVAAEVERFAAAVQTWTFRMGELLQGDDLRRHTATVTDLQTAGFDPAFAERGAALLPSLALLDVVEVAGPDPAAVEEVARLYFALSASIGFADLMDRVSELPQDDRWDSMARAAMRDDLYAVLVALTRAVRRATPDGDAPERRIAAWATAGGTTTTRALDALAAVRAVEDPGIATLSVALRTLRSLAG